MVDAFNSEHSNCHLSPWLISVFSCGSWRKVSHIRIIIYNVFKLRCSFFHLSLQTPITIIVLSDNVVEGASILGQTCSDLPSYAIFLGNSNFFITRFLFALSKSGCQCQEGMHARLCISRIWVRHV